MHRNQNFEKFTSLGFSIFGIFFRLSFLSFSFLFAAVICLLLGFLAVKKKTSKKASSRRSIFYHWVARCSGGKFWSEFFAQLFEHLCASLRLPSVDHSDQSNIKGLFLLQTFPRCQLWSEVEERPRLVAAGCGRHRGQWVKIHLLIEESYKKLV